MKKLLALVLALALVAAPASADPVFDTPDDTVVITVGQVANLSVDITNTGPNDLLNVEVLDSLGECTDGGFLLGNLTAGATATATCTLFSSTTYPEGSSTVIDLFVTGTDAVTFADLTDLTTLTVFVMGDVVEFNNAKAALTYIQEQLGLDPVNGIKPALANIAGVDKKSSMPEVLAALGCVADNVTDCINELAGTTGLDLDEAAAAWANSGNY